MDPKKYLDDDAKYWHRLWSVRISLLGAAFTGLWAALPAFQAAVSPIHFALACVGVSIATVLLRLLDQPSIPKTGDPNA